MQACMVTLRSIIWRIAVGNFTSHGYVPLQGDSIVEHGWTSRPAKQDFSSILEYLDFNFFHKYMPCYEFSVERLKKSKRRELFEEIKLENPPKNREHLKYKILNNVIHLKK